MNRDRAPNEGTKTSFGQSHRTGWIIAAAALLIAAAAAVFLAVRTPDSRIIDHITAKYTGSTRAGVVLDDHNNGFTVTAHFRDGHDENVTGWTITSPQTLKNAQKSVVTITYRKASTQCEVQCTTGMIQAITAEYDGETTAGTAITDATPGLHVYVIRDGGSKMELDKGWRVTNPTILKKDTLSRVQISYKEFNCTLSIQCTSRAISRLSASYSGSTEEGTVIGSGCKDVVVTASYPDGTSEQVSGWTLAESAILAPKERYLLEVHYEDSMCTLEVICTTPTAAEFQSGCISTGYAALYHNPSHYIGSNILVEGTIIERRPNQDGSVEIFFEMHGDFLGFTKGTLCASYTSTLHGDLPQKGAYVRAYGMFKGVEDRILEDASSSMPVMDAEYVIAV